MFKSLCEDRWEGQPGSLEAEGRTVTAEKEKQLGTRT